MERAPALSPDGTQVAFVWNGEQRNNEDIYVKPVDAVTPLPLRLTSDPLRDISPAWSPSGREIAFVRVQADGRAAIYVTPPIPGSERKVTDVRRVGTGAEFDPSPTWTPDGNGWSWRNGPRTTAKTACSGSTSSRANGGRSSPHRWLCSRRAAEGLSARLRPDSQLTRCR